MLQNWALLILRLTLGFTFILHGGQKVLGLFGGPGLAGFAKWAATYGISKPIAYLAAFAEFTGGILIFLGILTELGALLVIPVMLGAIFLIHGTKTYFIQDNGFEYPFILILLLVALIIGGPGKFALYKLRNQEQLNQKTKL